MEEKDLLKYVKKLPFIKAPEITETYKAKFEEMATHMRRLKPSELLLKRRPNEPDNIHQYRVDNYEPVTYGPIRRAYDNVTRIFTPSNFPLSIDNEKIKEYLESKAFNRMDFMEYFGSIVFSRMLEDANGFLCWLPSGDGLVDDSKNVLAIPRLVYSFNLIDISDDLMVILSPDKSLIEIAKGEYERSGKIYWIFTNNQYYTYTQKTPEIYELLLVYNHNLGLFPVQILGGNINGEGYYDSFFTPFVPNANEAIRQFSDWQALSMNSAHPITEVFHMNCEVQTIDDDDYIENGVPNPNGRNKKYHTKKHKIALLPGPHGVIDRPIGQTDPTGLGEVYLDPAIESVRYIRPPVEAVKAAYESYKNLLKDAESQLHLNLGEQNQSGIAKEIDLRLNDDFINKIGNHMADFIETSLKFIFAYYKHVPYSDNVTEFRLPRPTNYRSRTQAELSEELSKLKASNAPAMLIAAVSRQLAELRFIGDVINQKIFEIITTYDPLYLYSVSEKQSMSVASLSKRDDVTKSNYIYPTLLNIAAEIGQADFMAKTNQELYDLFTAKVEPLLIQQTPLVDNNVN
ncbi:MAG: hypothetical protein EKK61_03585 [Rickettsiales bacterium]|nr:MAG: hypothetical protein EKK61_03585 [Rickettsiales bacterium]